MKKNFAQSSDNYIQSFNRLITLTGNDLTSEVYPDQVENIFQKRTRFIDNCKSCSMKNFKNIEGDYGYGTSTYGYGYDTPGSNLTTGGNQGGNQGGGNKGGGFNWGDLLSFGIKTAGTYFTNQQQIALAEQQGEITRQQADKARADLLAEKQRTEQAGIDSKTKEKKSELIAAYAKPIAIAGGILILGIATYFFFKRSKKITQ